jgi:UDP-2,3-diacylglucosamine pyrophosphatase LpxH
VQEGRLIAISDVHLDTWRQGDPDSVVDKTRAFLEFLDWVRDGSGAEHFAIVGDLLDVPQFDHSPILPRYRDVLLHLWAIVQSGIRVYYIAGNHDAGLVGLDVAMAHPPFELVYPGVTVNCEGLQVRLEHGHLMDAWLWAYMQYKASHVAAVPPGRAMAHFTAGCDIESPSLPAVTFIYDTIYDALQWRPLEVGFTLPEKMLGITVMSQHLDDTFADVADAGELPRGHDKILDAVAAAGLTVEQLKQGRDLPDSIAELFWPIGERYYSVLPWRRAAQCRMRALRQESTEIQGLITGHIHHEDLFRWDEDGTPCVYANCGTWSGQGGSFVRVDGGEIQSYRRKWDEPLPEL